MEAPLDVQQNEHPSLGGVLVVVDHQRTGARALRPVYAVHRLPAGVLPRAAYHEWQDEPPHRDIADENIAGHSPGFDVSRHGEHPHLLVQLYYPRRPHQPEKVADRQRDILHREHSALLAAYPPCPAALLPTAQREYSGDQPLLRAVL